MRRADTSPRGPTSSQPLQAAPAPLYYQQSYASVGYNPQPVLQPPRRVTARFGSEYEAGAGYTQPLLQPPRRARAGSGYEAFERLAPPPCKVIPLDKHTFISMGLVLLTMLCFLPVWDSIDMLRNLNYAFWGPPGLPLTVIAVSGLILLFFFCTAEAFFDRWRNEIHTAQSLVVMSSLFVMLLGLVLVLVSLPLTHRTLALHNAIAYECGVGESTRPVAVHYADLLRVRQMPDCVAEPSVEACRGYREQQPITGYLKSMESEFRCSGFCYKGPRSNVTNRNAWFWRQNATSGDEGFIAGDIIQAPPTLFSLSNFQASCDGAAARNLVNFSQDTGKEMWYVGVTLISLSVVMNFWEWTFRFTK